MAEDRNPRRRTEATKQPKSHRRLNPGLLRWFLLVVPVIFVGAGTYVVINSPLLRVQDIEVNGAQTLDADELGQITGLKDQSMLMLDVDKAYQNVLSLPQVKSVSLERNWPNGVTLSITEREPAALWSVGGRDYAVAEDGTVLAGGAPSGAAPHVVEPDSNRVMGLGDRVHPDAIALAMRIYKESPQFIGQGVKQLEYRPDIGVTAVFQNGMRVTFGDERAYDYKVAVLSALLEDLASSKQRPPRSVDLRFGERVTYD
jgi:cell division protein FtsQ